MFSGCDLSALHTPALPGAQSCLPAGPASANSPQHIDGQDQPGCRVSGGGSRRVQRRHSVLTLKI